MDAYAPGAANVTVLAGSSAHMICFFTELDNPVACPVAPTIKVSGNPHRAPSSATVLT